MRTQPVNLLCVDKQTDEKEREIAAQTYYLPNPTLLECEFRTEMKGRKALFQAS